jgi:hypothetical protein
MTKLMRKKNLPRRRKEEKQGPRADGLDESKPHFASDRRDLNISFPRLTKKDLLSLAFGDTSPAQINILTENFSMPRAERLMGCHIPEAGRPLSTVSVICVTMQVALRLIPALAPLILKRYWHFMLTDVSPLCDHRGLEVIRTFPLRH